MIGDEFVLEEYKPNLDPTLSEIQECCKMLGIDKRVDPDLEYIAIELLGAEIPREWKFYRSKNDRNVYFFYNTITKKIQDQHPLYEKYLQLCQSEKQKKSDSYNLSDNDYDNNFENKLEIERIKQAQNAKIAELRAQQQIELNKLISDLDSIHTKRLKKYASKRDKYQLAIQKYTDFSDNHQIRLSNQLIELEKKKAQKIAEIHMQYEKEIREEKERFEKIKQENEEDFKKFQKNLEQRKLEEMHQFEKKYNDDKQIIKNKKMNKIRKKMKVASTKPLYIKPNIRLHKSKPFSLDIIDDEFIGDFVPPHTIFEAYPNMISDASSTASTTSRTEIPPFSLSVKKVAPKDFNLESSDDSSSDNDHLVRFAFQPNSRAIRRSSNKVEVQMEKTANTLKDSIDSTYNKMQSDFNSLTDTLKKYSFDINQQNLDFQQQTINISREFNSALGELENVHRLALNAVNTLHQTNFQQHFQFIPQAPLTPQPQRTKKKRGFFNENIYNELNEPSELRNTTGMRKLIRFTDALNSATKHTEKLNYKFQRAKDNVL